ncbi:MAG TPA: hypothetical protein VN915_12345, partial [Elusimicrobiota bacterium]|nr:hypothetical protein [Elusimicrobiota bacterium]
MRPLAVQGVAIGAGARGRWAWRRAVLAAVAVADMGDILKGLAADRRVSLAEGAALGAFVDLLSRPAAAWTV